MSTPSTPPAGRPPAPASPTPTGARSSRRSRSPGRCGSTRRRRCSCTTCRPTGGRRSPPRCWTGRPPSPSTRRRTRCTARWPSWSGSGTARSPTPPVGRRDCDDGTLRAAGDRTGVRAPGPAAAQPRLRPAVGGRRRHRARHPGQRHRVSAAGHLDDGVGEFGRHGGVRRAAAQSAGADARRGAGRPVRPAPLDDPVRPGFAARHGCGGRGRGRRSCVDLAADGGHVRPGQSRDLLPARGAGGRAAPGAGRPAAEGAVRQRGAHPGGGPVRAARGQRPVRGRPLRAVPAGDGRTRRLAVLPADDPGEVPGRAPAAAREPHRGAARGARLDVGAALPTLRHAADQRFQSALPGPFAGPDPHHQEPRQLRGPRRCHHGGQRTGRHVRGADRVLVDPPGGSADAADRGVGRLGSADAAGRPDRQPAAARGDLPRRRPDRQRHQCGGRHLPGGRHPGPAPGPGRCGDGADRHGRLLARHVRRRLRPPALRHHDHRVRCRVADGADRAGLLPAARRPAADTAGPRRGERHRGGRPRPRRRRRPGLARRLTHVPPPHDMKKGTT
ncbi:hypothetical protein SGPA1_11079 [Streptomyces misionensis JCM 4497]